MSKKTAASILMIGLLAIASAYGTYAWFTSQATSVGNTFTTGTLNITGPGQITAAMAVGNIYPSWTSSKTVTINNSGTLPFKYRLSVLPLTGNFLYDGPTPLQVKINSGNFVNINQLGIVDLGTLSPKGQTNDSAQIAIEFQLPSEADNAYQGVTGDFTFVFDAIQQEAAVYNGVTVASFQSGTWSGIQGYKTDLNLTGLRAQDLKSVEIRLYKDETLLAQNTSKDVLTLYPEATTISSTFGINSIMNDNAWNYGSWAAGHLVDIPNKVVVTVITEDDFTYSAVSTNLVQQS